MDKFLGKYKFSELTKKHKKENLKPFRKLNQYLKIFSQRKFKVKKAS